MKKIPWFWIIVIGVLYVLFLLKGNSDPVTASPANVGSDGTTPSNAVTSTGTTDQALQDALNSQDFLVLP